jgi:hypothetical protein
LLIGGDIQQCVKYVSTSRARKPCATGACRLARSAHGLGAATPRWLRLLSADASSGYEFTERWLAVLASYRRGWSKGIPSDEPRLHSDAPHIRGERLKLRIQLGRPWSAGALPWGPEAPTWRGSAQPTDRHYPGCHAWRRRCGNRSPAPGSWSPRPRAGLWSGFQTTCRTSGA